MTKTKREWVSIEWREQDGTYRFGSYRAEHVSRTITAIASRGVEVVYVDDIETSTRTWSH